MPPHTINALKSISHFLAEDVRTARRYLSSLKIYDSIESIHFDVLNKDTKEAELQELMKPLLTGNYMGVISESGCPGVADPGAMAVAYAHARNIQVIPLVGPSSILLALMASGLNGQKFAFHGYLPIDAKEAAKMIKELERESEQKNQTQLFIETPYRNNQVLGHLLNTLNPETMLSVARELTGTREVIQTKSVKDWKNQVPILQKEPVVFSFLAH
jgi:16S rRNA (cytidine1402-2'-O)-methyltransferase